MAGPPRLLQTESVANPPGPRSAEASGSALSLSASVGSDVSDASVSASVGATDRSMGSVLDGPSSAGATAGQAPRWKGKRVGRYRLINVLGKGSYGRVFLAEDMDLCRQVALKILSPGTAANSMREGQTAGGTRNSESIESAAQKSIEKTLLEARAAARIEHPNVVSIYEVGQLGATSSNPGTSAGGFIAMELLEGGSLQDLVKANGPMGVERACLLVADAAEALQFAHDQGMIHRDVKPANLMLSRHGRCKVVDFGLALVADPENGHRNASIAGTLMYVAPETTLGSPPSPKADQYSLGATLYTILAGRPPFVGSDRRQLLDAHRNQQPPSLRALRPDVPLALEQAILRAMDKEPHRRFVDIRQFGQTLRSFTSEATTTDAAAGLLSDLFQDLPPAAPPPPPPVMEPATIEPRRKASSKKKKSNTTVIWPFAAAGGAGLLLMLVLVLWAAGAFSSSEEADTQKVAALNLPPLPPPRVNQQDAPPQASQQQSSPVPVVVTPKEPTPSNPPAGSESPAGATGASADGAATAAGTGAEQPLTTGGAPVEPKPAGAESDAPAEKPAAGEKPAPEAGAGTAAGASTPQPPAPGNASANLPPLQVTDHPTLLLIAAGRDPQRQDKQAVVVGQVNQARPRAGDKVLRITFKGTHPAQGFTVLIDPANKQLVQQLQQKLNNKTANFGLEGKSIRVQGQVTLAPPEAPREGAGGAPGPGGSMGGPCIVLTSADQIEIVAAPEAPAQRGRQRRN